MNDSNINKFISWRKEFPSVQIVSDGSTNNDNKPGAVACMHFAVNQTAVDDDLMVIAGYDIVIKYVVHYMIDM